MMWKHGRPFSLRCLKLGSSCLNGLMLHALMLFVSLLLLMAPGCSLLNSTREIPTLPVLTSLQKATLNGVQGVWMSSEDAGSLALWIYDVTGEDGSGAIQ